MSIYKKEFVMNFRKTNNQQMRSGKVVVRSMLSTQVACLLNCLAPQLAVMLNNMMVSQFLGVDCFKASSVFSPVTGMILILINLCNLGPSLQAGTAYGKLDFKSANRLLTFSVVSSAVVSVIPAISILVFRHRIAEIMTSDTAISDYLVSYLAPIVVYLLLNAIASVLNAYVTSAGHAKKVSRAIFVSVFANVLSIFLLIKVAHLGIESVGIAMCISSATNILLLLPIFLNGQFPFHLDTKAIGHFTDFRKDFVLWVSVISGSISNALFQFFVNITILCYLPSNGLFVWGICLIAISIPYCFTAGFVDAYMYVDAFLLGEDDSAGRLKIAKVFLFEGMSVLLLLGFVFIGFSDSIAMLFGAETIEMARSVRIPIVCAIIFLVSRDWGIFYSVFSIQRKPLVKICFDTLSCLCPILLVNLAAIFLGGDNLWYGFAASSIFFLAYTIAVNVYLCHKDKNLIPIFLLDRYKETINLDLSVKYSLDSLEENMDRVRLFLNVCEINEELSKRIEICCEELMNNMILTKAKSDTFDLRLSEAGDMMCLFVKNLGNPASPNIPNNIVEEFVNNGKIPDVRDLSLFYIKNYSDKEVYHYVYGMNILYLQFNKTNHQISQDH